MFALFRLLNAHLLWTREVYPTAAYQSLGNLAPAAATPGQREPGERAPVPGRHRHRRSRPHRRGDQGAGSRSASTPSTSSSTPPRSLPQEEVLASLRLFAAEVMPAFRIGSALMLQGTADSDALAAAATLVGSRPRPSSCSAGRDAPGRLGDRARPSATRCCSPGPASREPAGRHLLVPARTECTHGPFTLAETRLLCRSGIRTRGYHVGAFVDNAEVARRSSRRDGAIGSAWPTSR